MIIILGPDGTGKTTLAKAIAGSSSTLTYTHFTKDSGYDDYINPLSSLATLNMVCDRWMLCEYIYAPVMGRLNKFTLKQFHNMILLTLAQNPVIVLATHKPERKDYSEEQYLPYKYWDSCMSLYTSFLNSHHISCIEYDYTTVRQEIFISALLQIEKRHLAEIAWWTEFWSRGYGMTGTIHPQLLIVAERLGPNNLHEIPFESGPTGQMMSELIRDVPIPVNDVAITNLVKDVRGATRAPTTTDLELLEIELTNMRPGRVIFMGTPARLGIPVADKLHIPHTEIVHLGLFNHKGLPMSKYTELWKAKISGSVSGKDWDTLSTMTITEHQI